MLTSPSARPVKVFCSSSADDEAYRCAFDKALAGLRRARLVETWSFRSILPGEVVDSCVAQALEEADIIGAGNGFIRTTCIATLRH
ncbi:hypothetical protein [Sorangium sp. So ce363]|uniref:hypothetical protein n=1 Tax=Sorangium sp. So ce363 TaxID=3133304 RepID=UPI003F63E278